MRLLLQNIRSTTKNFSELEAFLAETSEPEVIALTETWLSKSPTLDYFSLKNYQNRVVANREKRGGDVAFYVRENLACKVVAKLELNELQILTILLHPVTFLTVVYKPPSTKCDFLSNQLTEYILYLSIPFGQKHLVCGDFNIYLLRSSCASEVLKVTLRLFELESMNSESITRTCRGGGTTIHLCFANHDMTVSISETAITNHFTVLFDTKMEICNIDDNERCSYGCSKKLENEQTLLKMNFVLQHELVKNAKILTYGTSEVAFTKFFEILAQVLKNLFRKKQKSLLRDRKKVG